MSNNTAAPSPSDSSIAQAFREACSGELSHLTAGDFARIVENRAREFPVSSGGRSPCYLCDGKGYKPSHTGSVWCEACKRTGYLPELSAPAAAVGGDRAERMFAYVTDMATRHGWIEADGEGALEFLFRKHYTTGRDDAPANRHGKLVVDAELPGKLRCLNSLLQQMNAKEAAGAVYAAYEILLAATPAAPVGGFVLVPREPTEKMVIDGFESWPDPFFSTPEEWDAYEAMSGCQQAAHRARLCWAAMIAASPTAQPSAKDGVRGEGFWDRFPGWLIDHHEGQILTEELLQMAASDMLASGETPNTDNLRSCTICGLTVDVSKGHVAPSSDFTMQGRTKPKATTAAGLVDEAMVERAANWLVDNALVKWDNMGQRVEPMAYMVHARKLLEAAIGREVGNGD